VVVGHAFVAGCEPSESERELTVGGSAAIGAGLFADFDYVALGHLHRRQRAGSERIRYPGSLLKYSFGETDQQKSVTVVELDRQGGVAVQEVSLPVAHDVRRVRGAFEELLAGQVDEQVAGAYVEVILTDAVPVVNPVNRLLEKFPRLVSLRREETERDLRGPDVGSSTIKARSTADLFADFFRDVRGTAVSETQAAEVAAALDELERNDREAGIR